MSQTQKWILTKFAHNKVALNSHNLPKNDKEAYAFSIKIEYKVSLKNKNDCEFKKYTALVLTKECVVYRAIRIIFI